MKNPAVLFGVNALSAALNGILFAAFGHPIALGFAIVCGLVSITVPICMTIEQQVGKR